MKYYCESIPVSLAEKLKEKGMPIEMQPLYAQEAPNARGIVKAGVGLWCPSYVEVLDWLESHNIGIGIKHHWSGIVYQGYDWQVCQFDKTITPYFDTFYGTWHEAAEKAIEKALELIK